MKITVYKSYFVCANHTYKLTTQLLYKKQSYNLRKD